MDYKTIYQHSLDAPEEFWADCATDLVWTKPWDKVLDDSDVPFYQWFSGGEINTCYNALDRHCEGGRAEQAALIYDSPVTGHVRKYSYGQLNEDSTVYLSWPDSPVMNSPSHLSQAWASNPEALFSFTALVAPR